MNANEVEEKRAMESNDQVKETSSFGPDPNTNNVVGANGAPVEEEVKRPWWHCFLEAGHAAQIVVAAVIAIAIGLAVSGTVDQDDIPDAAIAILKIPGTLWLRALQAVVVPMIMTAMILAIQSLREISSGGKVLGRWTVGYYVLTTVFAVAFSIVMTSQIWAPMMPVATFTQEELDEIEEDSLAQTEREPHEQVVALFNTLIPSNLAKAYYDNELLALLVTAIVVGYMIKPGNSSILRVVKEVNDMIVRIITVIIKLAPIGVFFLILPNMFGLNIREVGTNLGILIGGSISSMFVHLWILLPIIYFAFTRQNPYPIWYKSSKAWVTAWGTASSAATLPMTLRVCRERGFPNTIIDFAVPLGCLINMDGTSIYFPMAVVFIAQTQDISLDAGQYILLLLLSTLSAIGTTPIPSSSLVLTVMIASALNIPMTPMFGVITAIDWFIDRFRTMLNVSGDIFAVGILTKVTGIRDPEILNDEQIGQVQSNTVRDNEDRV